MESGDDEDSTARSAGGSGDGSGVAGDYYTNTNGMSIREHADGRATQCDECSLYDLLSSDASARETGRESEDGAAGSGTDGAESEMSSQFCLLRDDEGHDDAIFMECSSVCSGVLSLVEESLLGTSLEMGPGILEEENDGNGSRNGSKCEGGCGSKMGYSAGAADSLVETGFVTGGNKKIRIERRELMESIEGMHSGSQADIQERSQADSREYASACGRSAEGKRGGTVRNMAGDSGACLSTQADGSDQHADREPAGLSHSSDSSQHIDSSRSTGDGAEATAQMAEMHRRVAVHFKKMESGWIFTQFKWAWLHLCLNPPASAAALEEQLIETMRIRLEREHSILRRIAEHDDIPGRFMALGILRVERESIEVFDGFYSAWAVISDQIYYLLRQYSCDIGSVIFVFGAERLLTEPASIFDIGSEPLLRLHYNGVRLAHDGLRLGYSRRIGFLTRVADIRADGGTVSAVVVRIKQIIERQYLVSIENYRNRTESLESEIDKIYALADKSSHTLRQEDLRVVHYSELLVCDESGECVLTWWNDPEDLKENQTYKFVHLRPALLRSQLHLSTSRSTYIERMP